MSAPRKVRTARAKKLAALTAEVARRDAAVLAAAAKVSELTNGMGATIDAQLANALADLWDLNSERRDAIAELDEATS